MSKVNTSAQFNKDINEILALASRSPSSHNTQPWRVEIKENVLTVGYASDRHLTVGDPEKRELLISLGCFSETVMKVGEEYGYSTELSPVELHENGVLQLTLMKSSVKSNNWVKNVKLRRSDRRLYESKELDSEVISRLVKLSCGNARIKIVIGREDIKNLSNFTFEATERLMSAQEFRNELAYWVRNNWTKRPDGMPGYTQGMPGPVSLFAKVIIKNLHRVATDQAKKDSKRVERSAAVGLIWVEKQTPQAWFDAGRLYQETCIEAAFSNVKTSAISAAVIDSSTVKKIISQFEISGRPVALIRFGYRAGLVKATPRLAVERFTSR